MSCDWEKCPAPAGMIPFWKKWEEEKEKMPRTCGDDPYAAAHWMKPTKNAPHLRG